MKIKNVLLIAILVVFLSATNDAVYAAETDVHVIERLQVRLSGVNEFMYLRPAGLVNWGGDECDPVYAYIPVRNHFANSSHFTLLMEAKLKSIPVKFQGTCDDSGRYFLISYVTLL